MKRTVFWKRMTALALAAILLLGLLPAAAFGAEPSDEPVQPKYSLLCTSPSPRDS